MVAPSQTGYAFSPATTLVQVKNGNVGNINFTASPVVIEPPPPPPPPPVQHSVNLTWTASTTPTVSAYRVYRAELSGGPYQQIGVVSGTAYEDATVASGTTYFYVATAVDGLLESVWSNEAQAVTPTP